MHNPKLSKLIAGILVVLSGMIIFSGSFAMAESSAWIGGLFGLSIPNASNTTSRSMFGIDGGAKVGGDFGVGAYFLSSTKDESTTSGLSSFNYDLYGIEVGPQFEGEAKGVYLSLRLGTSKVKVGTLTTSPFHWGAVAGYNHFLGSKASNVSIGGEASFISVASSSGIPIGGVLTQSIDAFSALNFLLTAKLWF
jgi:hypothetical protein